MKSIIKYTVEIIMMTLSLWKLVSYILNVKFVKCQNAIGLQILIKIIAITIEERSIKTDIHQVLHEHEQRNNILKIRSQYLNAGERLYYNGLNMMNNRSIKVFKQLLEKDRQVKKAWTHTPKINKKSKHF